MLEKAKSIPSNPATVAIMMLYASPRYDWMIEGQ